MQIKNIIKAYPFRLFLFAEIIFIVFRILFLALILINDKADFNIETPLTFLHAIRLDLAAATYISGIPILLWMTNQFVTNKIFDRINNLFVAVIFSIATIILLINLMVYSAWGTLINARAVSFITDPSEVIASLSTIQLLIAILIIILLLYIINKVYFKLIAPSFSHKMRMNKFFSFAWLIVIPVLIRGGLQLIPINESVCIFSKNENVNLATINPFWYLINSVYKAQNINKNAYAFIDKTKSDYIYQSLYRSEKDSCLQLSKIDRPNIITIVLESWTADVIESMGGEKGCTPFFTALEKDGLLFDSIYAAGKRTDLMFPSLFSGFPAMPNLSVIKYSDKTARLPFITQAIKGNGYQTSFNYGGEIEFANMKSYLTQAGFDVIKGKESFPTEQWTSKWGVYDEVLLNKSIETIGELKEPFYAAILTQSTHEPFAIPIAPHYPGNSEAIKFKNAAYYTDACLKQFFEKIKKEKWYKNTLIVLVADHGHILPKNRNYSEPAAFRIPLLITGPALADQYRNKRNHQIANQQDYAATIKDLLNLKIELPFSNSLININRNNFCYMNFDDGLLWKNDSTTVKYWYSNKTATVINGSSSDTTAINQGWSFIQKAYQYFIEL